MDNSPMDSVPTPSKLFIRSEVLAVMNFLATIENVSRQDKLKQIKRLHHIGDQETVLKVLLKELQRTAGSPRALQVVTELLMEVGSIASLQDPLWEIIRNEQSADEVKDAANLILRQLGDQSDPNLYLEYLDDPAGLINRETERMLEVSTRNPEALIDFIDFIFSLPVDEQCSLIASLQEDYPTEYLVNLYLPILNATPPYEVIELVLGLLGQTRSRQAARFLHQMRDYYDLDPKLSKTLKKSLNELKLAGVYRPDQADLSPHTPQESTPPHPVVADSTPFICFATLPDGIGNQGLVISRKKPNGDILMMSVAINDIHGIIDCFGFYEISETDFHRISEKFHAESSKITTPVEYCAHRLAFAETLNHRHRFRVPYEYSCWKVLLDDASNPQLDTVALSKNWANPQWTDISANLYQHPDFQTWFLEEGDHPIVTDVLQDVPRVWQQTENLAPDTFLARMETLAEAIVRGLMRTDWREILLHRLADTAYLLHQQKTTTFSGMAATDVQKLIDYPAKEDAPLNGFLRQYGRRCIEEDLLRRRQAGQLPGNVAPLVDHLLAAWEP